MTFWCAGFRNVTAAYGTGGFTDDHLAAFREHGVERVLIAFDRHDAGERSTQQVAERLMKEGLAAFRVEFPKGMDANDYARAITPAAKLLGVLIRKATWLGQGKRPELTSGRTELDLALGRPVEPVPDVAEPASSLAAAAPVPDAPALDAPADTDADDAPALASPLPPVAQADEALVTSEHKLALVLGDRRYRVRGCSTRRASGAWS